MLVNLNRDQMRSFGVFTLLFLIRHVYKSNGQEESVLILGRNWSFKAAAPGTRHQGPVSRGPGFHGW